MTESENIPDKAIVLVILMILFSCIACNVGAIEIVKVIYGCQ